MATGKLANLMAYGMQNYISGLPDPKGDYYDFNDGYNSIFDETEDFWNRIVIIDDHYYVSEYGGSETIIVQDTGVTVDLDIFLPPLLTNAGRRILLINENPGHRIHLVANGSDTIEGAQIFDTHTSLHKNKIEILATPYGWKRIGKEYIIVPESERPNGWVLNGGTSDTWVDVSFNTWVKKGATAVLLRYGIQLVGNGVDDFSAFLLRPKGSTIDNIYKNASVSTRYTNLPFGITITHVGQILVECDADGIIQYRKQDPLLTSNYLFLTINGYIK